MSSRTGDDVPSTKPVSIRDLKGRLHYSGEPKTLDEMDAGVVRGAVASHSNQSGDEDADLPS